VDVDPWTTPAAVYASPRLAGVDTSAVDVDAMVDVASWLLTEWAGRQEGTAVTARTYYPNRRPLLGADAGPRNADTWWDLHGFCGDRIELGGYVDSVLSVAVDGVTAADVVWRLDEHAWLVRTDGAAWWGTVVVDLVSGRPPSPAGVAAAVALAVEFVLDAAGGKCRLPANVVQVARQGVTVATKTKDPAAGRLGIPAVDAYLAAVNPKGRRRRGTVASPDTIRR
jgi:hypothetical protein